jgi:hypothetical protein
MAVKQNLEIAKLKLKLFGGKGRKELARKMRVSGSRIALALRVRNHHDNEV